MYIIIKSTELNTLKNLTHNWILKRMQIIIQLIMQSFQKGVVIAYLINTQNKMN